MTSQRPAFNHRYSVEVALEDAVAYPGSEWWDCIGVTYRFVDRWQRWVYKPLRGWVDSVPPEKTERAWYRLPM